MSITMLDNQKLLKNPVLTHDMIHNNQNRTLLEYLEYSNEKLLQDTDNQRLTQALSLGLTFNSVKAFEKLTKKIKH